MLRPAARRAMEKARAEPKIQGDLYLTVSTGFGAEAPVVDALLGRFAARRAYARAFALIVRRTEPT